jgi:hypothetical protein
MRILMEFLYFLNLILMCGKYNKINIVKTIR